MTSSTLKSDQIINYSQEGGNWWEIFKFSRLCLAWLTIIFGAVWMACWLFGEFIPLALQHQFGNTENWPSCLVWVETCRAIVPLVAVMVFIPINAMFMVLCERRGLALFTVRSGPNRVGPDGFFQTAADAFKLLLKEDITPRGADAVMFTLAPIIFFAPSIFGAIPLLAAVTGDHPLFHIANLETGIFFVLAASSIPVVGIVMGGWASNNKYSLVGGLRSAAQAISYEIPLVLSLITICMMVGSLDLVKIAKMQVTDYGLASWNVFGGGSLILAWNSGDPLVWLGAIVLTLCTVLLLGIYLTAACAEINRIPFDLPEAESELVSGYNTEYSGIKFAIFFLAEFTNLFIVASIATVMFLGGGSSPFPSFINTPVAQAINGVYQSIFEALGGQPMLETVQLNWAKIFISLINPETLVGTLWVVFKVYSIVLLAILVRGTLPRFRIDQLLDFGWKRLIPLSLILLLAVTFASELVRGSATPPNTVQGVEQVKCLVSSVAQ